MRYLRSQDGHLYIATPALLKNSDLVEASQEEIDLWYSRIGRKQPDNPPDNQEQSHGQNAQEESTPVADEPSQGTEETGVLKKSAYEKGITKKR